MSHLYRFLCFAVALALGIAPVSLVADRNYDVPGGSCLTANLQDAATSLTIYGDSRMDLIDLPLFGGPVGGWPAHFDLGANREWNIQNLGQIGWTTESVFNYIVTCHSNGPAGDPDANRRDYITANRYMVNIGGNDYIANGIFATFAPWRIGDIPPHVLRNQKFTLILLRKALQARGQTEAQARQNILWVSSYPAIARLPLSGSPKDQCFPSYWNECVGVFPNDRKSAWEELGEGAKETIRNLWDQTLRFVADNATLIGAAIGSQTVGYYPGLSEQAVGAAAWAVPAHFLGQALTNYLDDCNRGNLVLDSYCAWIAFNTEETSFMTLPSFFIFSNYHNERYMVQTELGMNYLDVYGLMVNPRDCAAGFCWGANPILFLDPAHPGMSGYALLGAATGKWLADHNWDQPWAPPVQSTTPVTPADGENIQPVVAPPSDGDLVAIICLLCACCWIW